MSSRSSGSNPFRSYFGKEEPKLPWHPVSNSEADTAADLYKLLLDMYWKGVKHDLSNIVKALMEYNNDKLGLSDIEKDFQPDREISGFEPFLDQISSQPLEASHSNDWAEGGPHAPPPSRRWTRSTPLIAAAVKENLNSLAEDTDPMFIRAQVLLQAAGLLDIDKLVEYRDPPRWLLWRKGQVPQRKSPHSTQPKSPLFTEFS